LPWCRKAPELQLLDGLRMEAKCCSQPVMHLDGLGCTM